MITIIILITLKLDSITIDNWNTNKLLVDIILLILVNNNKYYNFVYFICKQTLSSRNNYQKPQRRDPIDMS
jgi:hypothetical protein